jgi:hypothetical protein
MPRQASAIVTLILIKRQTVVAMQAAIAAKQSVDALMSGERAWLAAEIDPLPEDVPAGLNYRMACRVKNVGKTPAFITESGRLHEIVESSANLAELPTYKKGAIDTWGDRGLVLPPEGNLSMVVGYLFGDAETLGVYRGDRTLWVHGLVKYGDVYSVDRTPHEFRYCFRYYPRLGGKDPATVGFVPEGPAQYSKTT